MSEEVIYLRRYDWQGQRRNLKPKEGGERTIPIHSGFHWRIRQYLPMAVTKTGNIQIWKDDYKSKLKCWGSRWAKCLKDRYGFGSHDLRSHVVTKMMKSNINPFFLHAITGHRMPGTSSVLLSYVKPTVSEVRNVLKLLKQKSFKGGAINNNQVTRSNYALYAKQSTCRNRAKPDAIQDSGHQGDLTPY